MKKNTVVIFSMVGLLSVLLSGCQTRGEQSERTSGDVSGTVNSEEITKEEETTGLAGAEPRGSETEELISDLPYQFARKYGIIQSEYPVYELDHIAEAKLPQKEKTISLMSAICHNQELIVCIVLDDYSEVRRTPAGGEPPADGAYYTLSDGTMIASERYQNELWVSGEGLFLTGPGIPEDGIKPEDSMYVSYDPAYFEEYGYRRYFIEARFEIPSAPAQEDQLNGYALRLLDFEKALEFALSRVPEYETLEELAVEEHGSVDTHDGISIISMGERTEEGILVSWYVYRAAEEGTISVLFNPPHLAIDLPTISGNGKQYLIRELSTNPYWNSMGVYRLSDVKRYGRRSRCLFDVPQEEQSESFRIHIPGVTFFNHEESAPVTLTIPEDYEELNEDIAWTDGSVRILGITRMTEPQTKEIPDEQRGVKVRESPAVYIDVTAVHKDKKLALKNLICQRKLRWTGWEHERYDFDEKGNLSGFRIFYEEGDTEVTLKFHGAAFYWDQPFEMTLPLAN